MCHREKAITGASRHHGVDVVQSGERGRPNDVLVFVGLQETSHVQCCFVLELIDPRKVKRIVDDLRPVDRLDDRVVFHQLVAKQLPIARVVVDAEETCTALPVEQLMNKTGSCHRKPVWLTLKMSQSSSATSIAGLRAVDTSRFDIQVVPNCLKLFV